MKFRKLVYEALLSEAGLDLRFLLKKNLSKYRGVTRIFGLFLIEEVLNKYPELANLYRSLLINGRDKNDVEAELKQLLIKNPDIMTEIKNQVRKSSMDLSINLIKQSLELTKEYFDPSISGEKIAKIEDLLTNGSENELRKGLFVFTNEIIAEIEAELKRYIRYRPSNNEKIDWEEDFN